LREKYSLSFCRSNGDGREVLVHVPPAVKLVSGRGDKPTGSYVQQVGENSSDERDGDSRIQIHIVRSVRAVEASLACALSVVVDTGGGVLDEPATPPRRYGASEWVHALVEK
jgi:hypothetical protein